MNAIPVDQVFPNPEQPRTIFDQEELRGLAQSIKENGLIQPIVVDQVADDQYILIDGERRLRATKLLGWIHIDAIVRQQSPEKKNKLTQALVANVQRSQMGWTDEAKAYKTLIVELGSVAKVAEKTGVNASVISSKLRLLALAPAVQEHYNKKQLPFDLSVVSIFERLSLENQERLAAQAVSRRLTTTSILRAGSYLVSDGQMYRRKKKKEPGLVVSRNGHFSALSLVKAKPSKEICTAALETCRACPVYQDASPKICRRCPLPDFLNRLPKAKA